MDKADFYKDARNDRHGPIQGISVLDVTTTWAGPMAGCVLADLGADVIKVEHPNGDVGRRLLPKLPGRELGIPSETVHRNKRCITLDLSKAQGRDLFLKLAADADVVIENFKPGTMARWGVGYEQVRQVKDDIVYVSISGFGQFGPLSHLPGYDPVAQNFSGWTSLNGAPDGEPTKAPTFLGDDLAGLHGAIGALAALRHRDQHGEGQQVDVALVDSVIAQCNGQLTAGATGIEAERWGNQFSLATPVNLYPTRNNRVFVGVLLDSHWVEMCSMMGCEHLSSLGLMERVSNRAEVDSAVRDWCAQHTTEEVLAACAQRGLPATPVHTFAEAAKHEHLQARDMLQTVTLSDGATAPLTGPAAKFSRTPTQIRTPAPTKGQNNVDLLRSLGYDQQQINELAEHGVI